MSTDVSSKSPGVFFLVCKKFSASVANTLLKLYIAHKLLNGPCKRDLSGFVLTEVSTEA